MNKKKPKIIKSTNKILFDEILPFPISNNTLHQPNRWGEPPGITITKQAYDYYQKTKKYILKLREEKNIDTIKKETRIHAEVYFYEKDKRERDLNNYTKCLFDAMEMADLFENDSQIDSCYLQRMPELVKDGVVRVILKETVGVDKKSLQSVKDADTQNEQMQRYTERMNLLSKHYGKEQRKIAESMPKQKKKVVYTGKYKRKVKK